MTIYVVSREGHTPEGAFESRKLAEDHIRDRVAESSDRGHHITELEVVRITDRVIDVDMYAQQ